MKRFVFTCLLLISALSPGASAQRVSAAPSATILVTQASDIIVDDDLCSLREAIIAANTDSAFSGCPTGSGADVIDFAPELPRPITIKLLIDGANEDNTQTGDLDITGDLTIRGPTPGMIGEVVLDGDNRDRVFDIRPAAHVTISGLKIQHGKPDAGAEGGGATIGLTAVLTMTDSIVTSNQALPGGGIKVLGRLNLTNSTVSNNQGGGIRNEGGLLALSDVTLSGNTLGPGIYNSGRGSLTFNGGWVTNNQGGGIVDYEATATLTGLIIQDNGGSGVSNTGTSSTFMTISRCTIFGNSAVNGAGVFNDGIGATASIYNSHIYGNTASGLGGGVYNNGITTLTTSTVDQNQAGGGGGVNNSGGTLSLSNSTISGNLALNNGGGLYNRSDATLRNVTIYYNTASGLDTGGNIFNDEAQINLSNTILANSTTEDNCFNSGGLAITSLGHNLESANSCGFMAAGDLVNTAPMVGPLQDNGGYTPTHALLPGSPAIDAGTNVPCPSTDQRNAHRPEDGDGNGSATCDIGSYEYLGAVPEIVDLAISQSDGGLIAHPNGLITYTITYSNIGNIALSGIVITDTLPLHTTFDSNASQAGWTQVGDTTAYRFTLPSLAVSATGQIGISLRLEGQNPPAVSFITNTVQISDNGAHGPDTNLVNNASLTSTSTQAAYWIYLPMIILPGN